MLTVITDAACYVPSRKPDGFRLAYLFLLASLAQSGQPDLLRVDT